MGFALRSGESPYKTKCRTKTNQPSLVVRGAIVLGAVTILFLMFSRRLPSDATLVRQFNRERSAFIELASMLATNSPADPAHETMAVWSMEHYKRYRVLLRQARVLEVFRDGSEVRFQVAGPTLKGKGRRIAVAWSEAQPEPLIGSLDEFRKLSDQPDHAYRALGDGWFLRISN
jgi:hypothetical protein